MPSTRLHESSGRIEEIAAARRSDPTRLPRELRGDLDWIVMRALEKDPDRRYGTANDLARDVERHLAGDPVEAGPPTIGYRLRTYAKKYRAAVLSVAVLALTVLAGAGVATWQAVRATRAERLALAERDHARSVADLLRSVFGNLDPYVELAPGETPVDKLVEALEAAAARLTDAPATDPFIRRELQHTLALCLIGLGEFETAIPLVEAATAELDPNDPAGLDVWQVSAALQMRIGRLDECLATMERIEARFADALTADALSSLRENRARVLCQVERYDAAIPLLEQRLVDLGESGDSLRTRQGLAVALRGAGRTDEAIAAFDEVLRESERRYGTDHPWTTMSRNGLAVAYSAAGRYDEAIELLESVEASAGGLPEYHLDRISVRVNLATAYSKVGRADEARELLASCYERMLAKHGIGHHRTRDAACALADVCCNLGDVDAALTALAALTARFLEDDTTGDPRLLGTLDLVVAKLFQQRRAAEALPLIRAVHARRVEIDGERAAATLHSADSLASCHWMAGELEQSIPLFERTLEGCRATFGDRSERTLHVVTNLAVNYTSGGRFRDAEELTAEFLDEFEAAHGAHGRPTLMLHDLRCQALVRLDDPSRAAPVIEAMIERLEAAGIEGRATHWRDALARLERR